MQRLKDRSGLPTGHLESCNNWWLSAEFSITRPRETRTFKVVYDSYKTQRSTDLIRHFVKKIYLTKINSKSRDVCRRQIKDLNIRNIAAQVNCIEIRLRVEEGQMLLRQAKFEFLSKSVASVAY